MCTYCDVLPAVIHADKQCLFTDNVGQRADRTGGRHFGHRLLVLEGNGTGDDARRLLLLLVEYQRARSGTTYSDAKKKYDKRLQT